MKITLSRAQWTSIFQSVENELRITNNADDMTDPDTQDWAEHLDELKEKIAETLPVKGKLTIEVI